VKAFTDWLVMLSEAKHPYVLEEQEAANEKPA
jgi:hypothetical protein